MFYPESKEKFDENLFKNPTSQYRGTPFWAWNCDLDKNELLRQIEVLKEMGFGGFIMHSRSGMSTEYLSEDFFEFVKACTKKASEEKMSAWIYDEDRWPSGSAGGIVTKNPKYRQRMLLFTTTPIEFTDKEQAILTGNPYFIASFDIVLNENGELKNYEIKDSDFKGTAWYAYCISAKNEGWYNGQCYVDTLNKEAIKEFTKVTHEKYKNAIGNEFGKTVPAIFTDEPQFAEKKTLPFANSTDDVTLPWTYDFDITYKEAYGFDITEKLPELFWELPQGKISVARYYYHDHICNRFKEAFTDTCGKWCKENGVYLTGHVLGEHTLYNQAAVVGETMRCYSSFHLPGIDVLCDDLQLMTAKQVQSSARQNGKEGVMSELYGVTNWDFDFKGHKVQGDWQAALGITARVPHLSWVSMKGAAKRDFPASINYQAPWHKEYSNIENHFARLATVLTRGTPMVNVGVIHPVESYWLHWGPSDVTADIRNQIDENTENLINWLTLNTVDFDFISEATLPENCKVSDTFGVGIMEYKTIIVPNCETLRKTTVHLLEQYINKGGKVIFTGPCPKYIDGVENPEIKKLYQKAIVIPFDKKAIFDELKDCRHIEIRNKSGIMPPHFIYQMRQDNDCNWLFIANTKSYTTDPHNGQNAEIMPIDTVIKITGEFTPVIYNTFTGETEKISYKTDNGYTFTDYKFYDCDHLLLRLLPLEKAEETVEEKIQAITTVIDFKDLVEFTREEDNVCLLDMAKYSLDGGDFEPTEEVLRIDSTLRHQLGWSKATGGDVQPWAIPPEKISHYVDLEFTFNCEKVIRNTCFCAEELESLTVNGKNIKLKENGYYVDKAIIKYNLPALKKGKNTIIAKMPFGKRTSIEPCYITGDFDVELKGINKTIKAPQKEIAFGNITSQGMPFYSGNITYKTTFEAKKDCDILINASRFKGSLLKVFVDGEDKGIIITPPYNLKVTGVKKGTHKIEFKLFGNRFNTFGALHNCGPFFWYGIELWYSENDSWSYEYNLKETGVLKSPVIKILD